LRVVVEGGTVKGRVAVIVNGVGVEVVGVGDKESLEGFKVAFTGSCEQLEIHEGERREWGDFKEKGRRKEEEEEEEQEEQEEEEEEIMK